MVSDRVRKLELVFFFFFNFNWFFFFFLLFLCSLETIQKVSTCEKKVLREGPELEIPLSHLIESRTGGAPSTFWIWVSSPCKKRCRCYTQIFFQWDLYNVLCFHNPTHSRILDTGVTVQRWAPSPPLHLFSTPLGASSTSCYRIQVNQHKAHQGSFSPSEGV